MPKMPRSYPKDLPANQQGAVLIVVLLFLVLIIFAGHRRQAKHH